MTESVEPERDQPISSPAEFISLHELGLGRGVNVTDTHMWKNKTSFIVRKCNKDNIVKTKECGMYEKYEKKVLTISQEQQKIRLMLDDPSSQIKIGMDAQQTQTASSSMKSLELKSRQRPSLSAQVSKIYLGMFNLIQRENHFMTQMKIKNPLRINFVCGS